MHRNKSFMLLSFSSALIPAVVMASTYHLGPGGSGESAQAFYQTADWIDESGATVKTSPSAGNAYVVDSSRIIAVSGNGVNRTFQGESLQIGVVNGTGGEFMHCHENVITVNNLILANGLYRTWRSNTGGYSHVAGTTKVLSPASAPFNIHPTHNSGSGGYILCWDAAISGAEGTGLRFCPHPNAAAAKSTVVLTGDNSAYLGCVDLSGVKVQIASGSALGGALSSPMADACILRGEAVLEPSVNSVTLAASANRGLDIQTDGALAAEAGRELRIEWPVNASCVVRKLGAGTVTLASAWNTSDGIDVREGTLCIANGFSKTQGSEIVVRSGAFIAAATGETNAVDGVVFAGGGIAVSYDSTKGISGVLELSDGLPAATVLPVTSFATRGLDLPFLRVPLAKGELTDANFKVDFDISDEDVASARVEIRTEDGYSVAYLKTASAVVTKVDDQIEMLYCSMYPERWSDGLLPHADADYLVDGVSGFLIDTTESIDPVYLDDYKFPGGTLTLKGSSGKTLVFSNRPKILTADLRIGSYVQILASGNKKKGSEYPSGDQHVIRGRMHLNTTTSEKKGLYFTGYNSRTTVVESVISGTGHIYAYKYNDTDFTLSVPGTNNTYTGTWFIENWNGSKDMLVTFLFQDERSLGAATTSKQFKISGGGKGKVEIHPLANTIFSAANREIMFWQGPMRFRVDEGNTREFAGTVRYRNACALEKVGGGTFAITGYNTCDEQGQVKSLRVSEGYVRAGGTYAKAFSWLNITVAEGAGFEAKYVPGATDLGALYGTMVTDASKFAVEGQTVAVKIVTGGVKVSASHPIPFLTIPAAAATSLDGKKFIVTHDAAGKNASVVKDTVVVSGVTYVRYSVQLSRGLAIVVR